MTEKEFVKACLEPFKPEQIGQLAKGGVKLDYVGHAHVTGRLLELDPHWSWQPMAYTETGLPQLDENGGLWIWLTVNGITRIGYGESTGGFTPADKIKSAIGDAIRNAAMRFGIALSLWTKEEPAATPTKPQKAAKTTLADVKVVLAGKGATNAQQALEMVSGLLDRTIGDFSALTQKDIDEVWEKLK